MQPTWLRVLSPDDPVAVKNLEMAITLMGGEDGILVTPLPEQYKNVFGLPVTQGVYTGMNPGYYLWALAAAQHPLSEKAFNAMRQHATRTGTTPEYQILDDFLPLHLLFDETGAEPADYTARYRPWEGAINAEAVLFYLLGLRQDAVANRLSLAPHLPNGWSWLEAEGVRVGDARVDVRVERPNDSRWKVVLAAGDDSEKTPAIELALPLSDGSGTWSATVNGEPIELAVTQTAWGTRLGKVTGLVAPATLRVVR
jgi:hypothetical protein